jgi:hypothetical protein
LLILLQMLHDLDVHEYWNDLKVKYDGKNLEFFVDVDDFVGSLPNIHLIVELTVT